MAGNNNLDLTVAMSVGGSADVKRALNELGKSVRDTSKEIETAGHSTEGFKEIGEAFSELLGKVGGLAGSAASEIGELASAFTRLGGGAGGVVAAVTGLGTALGALALHGAEAAARLQEGANRVGTSVESYQGLAFAFQQSGSSAEGMEKALSKISEAQEKAIASADDYGVAAHKVVQFNEQMRESAERYSEQVDRINETLGESQRTNAINTAESIRKVQLSAAKDIERHGKDRARIEQDAHDHILEIQRAAALRQREEQRRAQLERERLAREHYRAQQAELRKHREQIEAEAEKAAKSVDKFTKEGIQILDATNKARDPVEVYKDAARAVAAIEDPATRAAKAVELFGRRAGPQLVENLSRGKIGIDELIEEAKKLGIILSKEEAEMGKGFKESFEKMLDVVNATINKFSIAISPAFKSLTDAISEGLAKAQPYIVAFGEGLNKYLTIGVTGLKGFGTALGYVLDSVGTVGAAIMKTFGPIAGIINTTFGTQLTETDIPAFVIAMGLAIKVVRALAAAFTALVFAGGPWTIALKLISLAVIALVPVIRDNWTEIVHWIKWAYDQVAGFLDKMLKKIQAVGTAIGQFLGLSGGAGGGGGSGDQAEAHAAGGHIRGPGTGTSDSIPARLSNGEYVVKASSVSKYGVGMMDAVNAGRFAMGGLVDRLGAMVAPPPLMFAGGGAVPGGAGGPRTPINLHMGGHVFAMSADDHVAGALVRYSAGKQMSSAGTKPSWYAGKT
jgi:hypothetical protein